MDPAYFILAMLSVAIGCGWGGILFAKGSVHNKLKNLIARRIIQVTNAEGKSMTGEDLISLL